MIDYQGKICLFRKGSVLMWITLVLWVVNVHASVTCKFRQKCKIEVYCVLFYSSSIPLRVWGCSFSRQLLSAGFADVLRHHPHLPWFILPYTSCSRSNCWYPNYLFWRLFYFNRLLSEFSSGETPFKCVGTIVNDGKINYFT